VLVEPLLDAGLSAVIPRYALHGVFPLSWLTVSVMLVFTFWSGINYIKAYWGEISTDW
jgi:phosphatidylglycerophosphate synthase